MSTETPKTIFLKDFAPTPYVIDEVEMRVALEPSETRVTSTLSIRPNPKSLERNAPLVLDGETLSLARAAINGTDIPPTEYILDDSTLTIARVPQRPFKLTTEVTCNPTANTALSGLYMSNGMYCTQCEAEGFRRITYYYDRPDVMARFSVRIDAPRSMPVLLSNGNPGETGDIPETDRHFAEWSDPHPKPAYLFALVAGDLAGVHDRFTTMSGRDVQLGIYVEKGKENRCAWAMQSLKESMRWDEERFGREYDLDVFNIVAVSAFNMGAMENKGLNIFNDKYVLASPATATDTDYDRIEAIIAHEYFHNWTGNRITCRDWFQLCLKEGLTVFRDQQFTSDMRSAPVKRIDDVLTLRARQFREDMGPLAHPVRPDSFVEINNFYTATVYEKGAEVIGMLKRLVGDDGYRKALDLYFERHDGDAATIEDWLKVFEDATGRDLTQFKRWYTDAGTPRLAVAEDWEPGESGGTYRLTFTQKTAPTPGQPDKPARVIPIAVGLLNPNGDEVVPTRILEMTEATQTFAFEKLASRPIPSILRGFSAPVVLDRTVPPSERAFLLAHDTDPFNRWEAGRGLAKDVLGAMILEGETPSPDFIAGLEQVLTDETLDPAFRALCLRLPSDDDMAQAILDGGHTPDPDRIHAQKEALARAIAARLEAPLAATFDAMQGKGTFTPDAASAGRRALRLACLSLLNRRDGGSRANELFGTANNMTEMQGALACLIEAGRAETALRTFYARFRQNRLVIDKWFTLQVAYAAPNDAVSVVSRLAEHPDFDWKNPNRFRALLGALSANHGGFHHSSGAGYDFYANWLIRLDPVNPQTTARMSTAFETWKRYDASRQSRARSAMERILALPNLSRDSGEMIRRLLGTTA